MISRFAKKHSGERDLLVVLRDLADCTVVITAITGRHVVEFDSMNEEEQLPPANVSPVMNGLECPPPSSLLKYMLRGNTDPTEVMQVTSLYFNEFNISAVSGRPVVELIEIQASHLHDFRLVCLAPQHIRKQRRGGRASQSIDDRIGISRGVVPPQSYHLQHLLQQHFQQVRHHNR